MGSIARQTQYQQLHFIRATVAYNTPNIASGVIIGHLPNGAVITDIYALITTAQNAATTNTYSVGTISEVNGVLQAALTAVTNLVSAGAAGTVAFLETNAPIAAALLATDAALVVSLAQSGTAATAGSVTFVVTYSPNL